MSNDLYLYKIWLDYLIVKKSSLYCFICDCEENFPLCNRHIKNKKYETKNKLILKITNYFKIRYSNHRSVFSQKRDWGTLSNIEILALINKDDIWHYIIIIGIDNQSDDILYLDLNLENENHLFLSDNSKLFSSYDKNIYSITSENLSDILYSIIVKADTVKQLGYENIILFDDMKNDSLLAYKKGLTLLESWFTYNITTEERPSNCVVNATKYETEDLLLMSQKLKKIFNKHCIYSNGKDIVNMVEQLFEKKASHSTKSIIAFMSDGNFSHSISLVGCENKNDFIIYYDPNGDTTLITTDNMPLIKTNPLTKKKYFAIYKEEFAKIVYAIFVPENKMALIVK